MSTRVSSSSPGLLRRAGVSAALLLMAASLASCTISTAPNVGPSRNIEEESQWMEIRLDRVIDHDKDNWNYLGLWRRVGKAKPAIYAPTAMPASVPLDEKHGVWVVDANDGVRIFVPNGGAGRYPASTLKVEAMKVTNRTTKGRNALLNGAVGALGVALSPLQLARGLPP